MTRIQYPTTLGKLCILLSFLLLLISRAGAQAPLITQQPQGVFYCSTPSGMATFAVSYSGASAGEWQYSVAGSNVWTLVPATTTWEMPFYATQSYLTANADSLFGYQFRCVLYANGDSVVSNAVAAVPAPIPVPTITSAPLICPGSKIVLTASDANDNVQWYLDGAPVNTGQQDTVYAAGNYTVSVSDTFGCAAVFSAPDSVIMGPAPAVPVITVTQTHYGSCAPDTATLSVASQPGCTYSWYFNDDFFPLDLSTGDSALATISGSYSASVVNSSGCATNSADVFISIPTTAAPTAFTSQALTVCRGQQGVTYTISPDSAATAYTWSYSGTGATISGNGTSVTVDFGAAATSGNLSVQDSGYSCLGDLALTIPVQVDSIPAEPGNFIAPDSIIAIGDPAPGNNYFYTIPSPDSTISYVWSFSGSNAVQTYTDTAATLQFYNENSSGVLSVSASNECGVSAARSIYIQVFLPVTLNTFTAQPQGNKALLQWTTTEEVNPGTFRLSRTFDHINWTQLTLVPFSDSLHGNTYSYVDPYPANGINYYELACIPSAGADSVVMDTALNMDITDPGFIIAPNPVVSTINVIFNAGEFQTAQVISLLGEVLLTEQIGSEAAQISLPAGNLPAGMYVLRLTNSTGLQKARMFVK